MLAAGKNDREAAELLGLHRVTFVVSLRCVAVPAGVICQDEAGGLWDLLFMLRMAIGRGAGGPEVRFAVHVRTDNRERTPPLVRLKALCGPGDTRRS